jgi:hypothetical protein
MTFIFGSKCKNDVVMVADRKFTINNGTDYEYDDKLWGDIGGVIAGFLVQEELFRTKYGRSYSYG